MHVSTASEGSLQAKYTDDADPAPLLACLPRLSLPPSHRWLAVARERRRLSQFSDDVLRDIGVARADARREAARPF